MKRPRTFLDDSRVQHLGAEQVCAAGAVGMLLESPAREDPELDELETGELEDSWEIRQQPLGNCALGRALGNRVVAVEFEIPGFGIENLLEPAEKLMELDWMELGDEDGEWLVDNEITRDELLALFVIDDLLLRRLLTGLPRRMQHRPSFQHSLVFKSHESNWPLHQEIGYQPPWVQSRP